MNGKFPPGPTQFAEPGAPGEVELAAPLTLPTEEGEEASKKMIAATLDAETNDGREHAADNESLPLGRSG